VMDLKSHGGMVVWQVNLVTYLGSEVIYEVSAKCQLFTIQISNLLKQGTFHRGDKVWMNFDIQNIFLIKE